MSSDGAKNIARGFRRKAFTTLTKLAFELVKGMMTLSIFRILPTHQAAAVQVGLVRGHPFRTPL